MAVDLPTMASRTLPVPDSPATEQNEQNEMKMIVEGMTCNHCVQAITHAIQQLDPLARVEVDLGMEEVNVAGDLPVDAAVGAIQAAGYGVAAILGPDTTLPANTRAGCCGTCQG